MDGNFERGQRTAPSLGRLTTLLPGGLERGRAAPAEGVHGDEISHEAASPKFEAVWIFAIAAVLVPIAHLAAPLFCCT